MKTKTYIQLLTALLISMWVNTAQALTIVGVPTGNSGEIMFNIACFTPDDGTGILQLDFGDGTPMLSLPPGVISLPHIYALAGNYTACVNFEPGDLGIELTACTEVFVAVWNPCPCPNLAWVVSQTACGVGAVNFGPGTPSGPDDITTGLDEFSCVIDWGDGMTETTSNLYSTHTYDVIGDYIVSVTQFCIGSGGGNGTESKPVSINSDCLCLIDPDFDLTISGCDVMLSFPGNPWFPIDPNGPSPVFSYYWGDGSYTMIGGGNDVWDNFDEFTFAIQSHIYDQSGTYNVTVSFDCPLGGHSESTEIAVVESCIAPCVLPTSYNHAIDGLTFSVTSLNFPIVPNDFPGEFTSYWSFGDGTFSTEAMPSHTYPNPGTFYNCWTVTCQGVQVQIYEAVSVGEGCCPLPVNINFEINGLNISVTEIEIPGFTGMNWDDYEFLYSWGDGTFSSDPMPSHEFPEGGNFSGCILVACQNCGAKWYMYPNWSIEVEPGMLPTNIIFETIGMTTSVVEIVIPGYTGTDFSEYTFFYSWGDGTFSGEAFASHTYEEPGIYFGCQTVADDRTGDKFTLYYQTSVAPLPCELPESFNVFSWEGQLPNAHQFYFNPVGICIDPIDPPPFVPGDGLNINWDFGDGTASSEMTPVHHYALPGIYVVCMTATCSSTGNEITMCQYISTENIESECFVHAAFHEKVESPTVNFFNTCTYSDRSAVATNEIYVYQFGDGTTSNNMNPTHTYSSPGDYIVSITYGVLWDDGVYCENTTSHIVHISCQYDLDGNGSVNVVDLLLMMSAFGQSCGEVVEAN